MEKRVFVLIVILIIVLIVTGFSFFSLKKTSRELKIGKNLDKAELLYKRAEQLKLAGDKEKERAALKMIANNYPHSAYSEISLRQLAKNYENEKNYEKAQYYYEKLLGSFSNISDAEEIKNKIQKLKTIVIQSSLVVGESAEYIVKPGDTLYAIAKKFNTTVELIKSMNSLKSDVIHAGEKLKINTAKFSIVVDKSKNILILEKDGEPFKTYKVATGKNKSTPVGKYTIIDKMIEPPWTKPGVGIVMPGSEEYELGARWMPISLPGYGIHGTHDDSYIGKYTTSGCIRMHNEDVIELYNIVPKGTEVNIVEEAAVNTD